MMTNHPHKIQLQKEMETLLITLYAKASDNRSNHSILNDYRAEEILNMIDYDFEKLKGFGNEAMILRAKQIDAWLIEFLNSNPDAVILNLGCGLDTRISRVAPPSSVRWFDLDFPEVIELRKLFYSDQQGYKMIPSSVTNPGWLEPLPKEKPAMIIAEGMLEYLPEAEVKKLLNRLTDYFPQGQITFDVMNAFAVNSGKDRLDKAMGAAHQWTVDTLSEVDRLNPKLTRLAGLSIFKSKYIRKLPLRIRSIYTVLCLIPSFKKMIRVLLYRF